MVRAVGLARALSGLHELIVHSCALEWLDVTLLKGGGAQVEITLVLPPSHLVLEEFLPLESEQPPPERCRTTGGSSRQTNC